MYPGIQLFDMQSWLEWYIQDWMVKICDERAPVTKVTDYLEIS